MKTKIFKNLFFAIIICVPLLMFPSGSEARLAFLPRTLNMERAFLPPDSLPEQVCDLYLDGKSNCSGTLISPTSFLTNFHCIMPFSEIHLLLAYFLKLSPTPFNNLIQELGQETLPEQVMVSCRQGKVEKIMNRERLKTSTLILPNLVSEFDNPNTDLAVIEFDSPFPIAPLEVATPQEFSDKMGSFDNCAVFGYGQSRPGELRAEWVRLLPPSVREHYSRLHKRFFLFPSMLGPGDSGGPLLYSRLDKRFFLFPSMLGPGDSGGPLLCLFPNENGEDHWKVIGVNSEIIRVPLKDDSLPPSGLNGFPISDYYQEGISYLEEELANPDKVYLSLPSCVKQYSHSQDLLLEKCALVLGHRASLWCSDHSGACGSPEGEFFFQGPGKFAQFHKNIWEIMKEEWTAGQTFTQ